MCRVLAVSLASGGCGTIGVELKGLPDEDGSDVAGMDASLPRMIGVRSEETSIREQVGDGAPGHGCGT